MRTHSGTRIFPVPYNGAITAAKVKWHSRPTGIQLDAITTADGMQQISLESHVEDSIRAELQADIDRQHEMVGAV